MGFLEFLKEDETWVAISFILFAALIWFKGRKAILGALDSKIAVIREEVETAQNLRIEAERLFADYERKHQESLEEADHVIRTAQKQAGEIRKQADADLAETIAKREEQLEERIARMKQSAIEDIRRYAADLAIEATAGIIAEKLDKKTREQLIDQAIRDIGEKAH